MIPFFKTDASLGKSILTLNPKDSRSIFNLELPEKTVLVEDDMSNIFEAAKNFKEKEKQFIFGLRVKMANSIVEDETESSEHKLIVFARNQKGVYELMDLFSQYRNQNGVFSYENLNSRHSENIEVWVPFYDSYLHKNFFKNGDAIPNFGKFKPKYCYEQNNVAFDGILKSIVNKVEPNPVLVKSIYYKDRDDFKAWQTFKIACSRFTGKENDINRPNLEYCSSREFSWESYVDFKRNS